MESTSRLLRSILPPWGDRLSDPLLQYEARTHRRAGGRPWAYVFIVSLLALGVVINLALVNIFAVRSASSRVLAEETVAILIIGLSGMSVLGHWRLLLSTIGRSSAAISQKRERGDWDLIFITPVSKSRWFQAQLTALGWQIFPLVRRLMIVNGVMIVVALPVLIVLKIEEGGDVSPLIYALEMLAFAALIIVEPIFSAGIFVSSALVESSLRQRAWVSFLTSLGVVYLMRLVMSVVLLVTAFVILVALLEAAVVVGLEEEGANLEALSSDEVFLLLFYGGIGALVTAFIIEWVPPAAAILMIGPTELYGNILAYVWFVLTFLITYIILPPILMRLLAARTVKRLNRPEI